MCVAYFKAQIAITIEHLYRCYDGCFWLIQPKYAYFALKLIKHETVFDDPSFGRPSPVWVQNLIDGNKR